MYLVAIAWLYVALMMALAEALHPSGGWLGAAFTFVLYGLGPVALAMYLLATPMRRRARRRAEQADRGEVTDLADAAGAAATPALSAAAAPGSVDEPDDRGHAPGPVVAPVRKEP